MLQVTLISHSRERSVSVYDSDLLGNLIHMEAIIGTLVRYGIQGVYEPYFAKGWSINKKNTEFKFFLEDGLLDEKGSPLNAESYYKSFHILLKKYSQTNEPPIFSSLIGWNEFKQSKTDHITGIKFDAAENTISFSFTKSVSGLMEFLAMPYYGFYNINDFNSDGTWKDKHKITATGGYKLISISDIEVILQQRENFKLNTNGTYKSISITSDASGEATVANDNQMFIHNTPIKFANTHSQIKTFKSIPTLLFTFEINPKSKALKEIKLRRAFYNLLKNATQRVVSQNSEFTPARGFYSDKLSSNVETAGKLNLPIITYLKKKNPTPTKYDKISELILTELASKDGLQIKITDNVPGQQYVKPQQFNSDFDFRIKAADIGYKPETWVIKMMFCSDMGVSFADPDKQVLKFTNDYEEGKFSDVIKFESEFEKILIDQATIVPIFRDGYSFSISRGIDPASISRTTNVPRIDLIKPVE